MDKINQIMYKRVIVVMAKLMGIKMGMGMEMAMGIDMGLIIIVVMGMETAIIYNLMQYNDLITNKKENKLKKAQKKALNKIV